LLNQKLVINRPPPQPVQGAAQADKKPEVDESFIQDFLKKQPSISSEASAARATNIMADIIAHDKKVAKAKARAQEKQGAIFNVDNCSQISSAPQSEAGLSDKEEIITKPGEAKIADPESIKKA